VEIPVLAGHSWHLLIADRKLYTNK